MFFTKKMTRNILIRIAALVVIAIVIVGVFIYITKSPKPETTGVETKAGYSTVTSVAGCTFMVNSAFSDSATAVTQISDGVNFETSDFYSYKNGKDQYMLFCLDSAKGLVVAVEKGTNFNLAEADKADEAVKNADIMGIWFGTDKEGLKLKKSGDRCEGNATAQVVITNDLFNDFVGKIVTENKNGEEWAMFVGVPGDRYKKLGKAAKSGIEAIADSFHLSSNTGEFTEPEYAVVIDGTVSQDIVDETVSSGITEVAVETTVSGGISTSMDAVSSDSINEGSVSDNSEEVVVEETPVTEEGTETPVEVSEETEEQKEEPKEESKEEPKEEAEEVTVTETTEEVPVEEGTEESEHDSDIMEEPPVTEETEEASEEQESVPEPPKKVTVQSIVAESYDDGKAYTSSAYSMLNVGQTGIFETFSKAKNGNEQLMGRILAILDSKTTYSMIEDAIKTNRSPLKYFDAPPGCHWESAVYSVNYAGVNDHPYVNVKFVGADGKALKFRGIKYPTITYDLYTGMEHGTWTEGMMVYYAVPNGCTEYVLKIGDGDDINKWKAAYIYVNRKKEE